MVKGTFTALVTPFKGKDVDMDGLARLIEFQIKSGVTGILAVGTTGESPVLSWEEHNAVVEAVANATRNECLCIAGTGSNNTAESLAATEQAANSGADAVLLVEPYYNGPSSAEIRREYIAPIARTFPGLEMIPYVIPGRTGTQLLPEDLALLHQEFNNVASVKEATADIANMRRTRELCGENFSILSGDDGMTFSMMTDPAVKASGVISVASNIVPGTVVEMVRLLEQGKVDEAEAVRKKIEPLFGLVTVKTVEQTPFGEVVCRARNPLATKALMAILGMPSGPCRQPLGRLMPNAMNITLEAMRKILRTAPEVIEPLEKFFNVDVEARINNPDNWEDYCYTEY